jgi:hypothetical protein
MWRKLVIPLWADHQTALDYLSRHLEAEGSDLGDVEELEVGYGEIWFCLY